MSWDPSSLGAGLVIALDVPAAIAAGKAWQDVSKTIPATKPGDLVRVITDPWSGIDWTAPSDAARPALRLLRGVWTLESTATTAQTLRATVSSVSLPITAVLQFAAIGFTGSGFNIPLSGGANTIACGWDNADLFVFTATGIIGSASSGWASPNTLTAGWSTTAAFARVNGSSVGTGTNAAASATTWQLFSNNAGSFYKGRISRLVIASSSLAGSDLTGAESWVAGGALTDYWIMPTFTNSSTGAMLILQSGDGNNWDEQENVSFTPDSPDGTSGDYSIYLHTDNYFYLAYTRTRDATLGGLSSFGLSRSTDGIAWTNLANVDVSAIAGVQKVWAPEFFADPSGNLYVDFATSLSATYDSESFSIYTIQNTSLGASPTWSTITQLLAPSTGNSFIDPDRVKVGSEYYLWCKNESSAKKYIEVYSAATPTGTVSALRTGDWAGWGSGVEGSTTRLMPDGTTWQVWMDRYGAGTGMATSDQTAGDWTGAGSTTWSVLTTLAVLQSGTYRHGTPLRIVPVSPAIAQIWPYLDTGLCGGFCDMGMGGL